MKKIGFLIGALAMVTLLSSCKKDEPILGANVKVTVKNYLGIVQKGTTVYMYKDHEPNNNTRPSEAKQQVITDDNGVAEFRLNFANLDIFESQTSLYFAVFYTNNDGETRVAGSTGVTVKRDESKNLDLTIPL